MNAIVKEFISYFLKKDKRNCLLVNADFSDRGIKKTLFGLNELSSKNKVLSSLNYSHFKKEDNKKYGLIIAELPFGLGRVKNKNFKFSIPENWETIYRLLNNLENDGVLLVGTEPVFGISTESKRFLCFLKEKKIFLKGLVETPKNILAPLTSLQPNIAIFSKQDNQGKIFIASLDKNDDPKKLIKNFNNREANNNLIEGEFVTLEKFKGFFNYRISKEIDNLQAQYKEFQKKYLNEIAIEANSTRTTFKEEVGNEYLYIPQIGNLNVYSDLDKLDKKHQNYYQIKINEKDAYSKYLEQYFKSSMGQLSLRGLLANTFIPRINKSELKELLIPLPSLKVQEEIISSYELLDNVSNVISKIENDLSLNPKNAKEIINKLTNTLDVLNELSKKDRVLSLIREGESSTIEFKRIFSNDVNKKDTKMRKEIEKKSLKNIVGFLNKKGGVLLIGVTDDRSIYGIENDNYKSDDKYLLHFKDKLQAAIKPEILGFINYEIVEIDDKKILMVNCKPSDMPVFLYPEGEFYVRTNPATDELKGPDLTKYVNSHFAKY